VPQVQTHQFVVDLHEMNGPTVLGRVPGNARTYLLVPAADILEEKRMKIGNAADGEWPAIDKAARRAGFPSQSQAGNPPYKSSDPTYGPGRATIRRPTGRGGLDKALEIANPVGASKLESTLLRFMDAPWNVSRDGIAARFLLVTPCA
jgi:hypothetical protein